MDYIGVTEDKDKVTLLKNWGGSELTEFMRTSAKAKLEVKGDDDADQYDEIVRKTREEMKRLVNRTLAMHNLLTTKQGSRSWMEFIKDLEDKAYLLDFDNKPYRQEDAVKDAAIFGMSDSRLKEKALTEDPKKTLSDGDKQENQEKKASTTSKTEPNMCRESMILKICLTVTKLTTRLSRSK